MGNEKPIEQYMNFILFKTQPRRKLRIVFDAGNGTACLVAGLFERAGHELVRLFCDIDGSFPNRLSDPHEDRLDALRQKVVEEKADVGFAFDGDGDRLVVVSDTGHKLSAEHVAYLCLKELLKLQKGPVVANVECTRIIDDIAKEFGCNVIRVPVGHTFLMESVHKHHAVFGTEVSGHACMPSIVPFDDAIAVAYFISCNIEDKLSETVKRIPRYPFERISIKCIDEIKFRVIDRLKKRLAKKYDINAMDGIRIELDGVWVLIRASNTEPKIRLTIEALTKEELVKVKDEFTELIKKEIEY